MSRYWCSFIQPTEDYRPLTYPPNGAVLGWWCSGYDLSDNAIICALISADDEKCVWNAIIDDWPEALSMRFCDEVADDWRPSDRFVIDQDWMKERMAVQ